MIELKVEIKRELSSIKKKKDELKEEILSQKNNEKITSFKLNFSNLTEESKFLFLKFLLMFLSFNLQCIIPKLD